MWKFFWAAAYFISCEASADLLSKMDAYNILKSQGFKWNLTKTLDVEAQAKTAESRSELYPQIQFALSQYAARINPIQFGGTNPETIDTVGFGSSAIEMKWTVLDSLTNLKILSAKANEKMTAWQVLQFQNELTALMLLQYLSVQRLKMQLDFMDANIEKSKLIVKLAGIRSQIGAGISLDVSRAKNLAQLDQLKKMALYTKYMKARHELAQSLGQENLTSDIPPLEVKIIAPKDFKVVLDTSLQRRGDLRAADVGFESAQEAQSASKGFFYPKIELLSEFGTTQPSLFGMPAKTANGFVGVIFSVPLETGGLIAAKRQEASAMAMKAELNLRQLRFEIDDQVKESMEQLMAAREGVQISKDYLETAEQESHLAEKKYQAGSSGILDLTNAHANLASARDMQVENIFNYEATKIGYFRAAGDFTEYFATEKRP